MLDPRIHHNNLLNSILAKIEANAAGADDALMLDGRGFLAETNATHVFLVMHGTVVTPQLLACPEGITRGVVLELCRAHAMACHERDVNPAELFACDEAFCTGTMGELTPIVAVDGLSVGMPPRPIYGRLCEMIRQQTLQSGILVCD